MIRVLILTYNFPDEILPGALRPYSWYKHLKDFNIDPIVITKNSFPQLPTLDKENDSIIKVNIIPNYRDKLILKHGLKKYRFLRKFLTLYYAIFSYVSIKNDASSPIYFAAKKYLKKNKVDIIIATGEPFILFKYAARLSLQFNLPWIADYRDGWSTNYAIHHASSIEKFLMKNLYKNLEKKYIQTASAITTVSKPISIELEKLHHKKVTLLLNGYEEEDFTSINGQQSKDIFTIAYAGSILSYQRLDVFMKGFEEFIKESNANTEVVFYGLNDLLCQTPQPHTYVCKSIHNKIKYTHSMPHKEVLQKLSDSNLLLILSNEKIDGSCSKLFEYLALNRKIIVAVNDSGTLEKIINETNSGYLCNNKSDVKNVLVNTYHEWQKNKTVKSTTSSIKKYSRKEQTKLLAELINNTIS